MLLSGAPQASFDPVPYQLQMEAPAEEPGEAHGEDVPASTSPSNDGFEAGLVKGTRVLIVGNSRSKARLTGLTAVVRKNVGLGGWHELCKCL